MEIATVVCPVGVLPGPAICDADAYCIQTKQSVSLPQHPAGSQLLAQLQDCNDRAHRLLILLSIYREQGIGAYGTALDRLFGEAVERIKDALQAAAGAKQSLLTTSSQHSSAFCKLLERLHLLDALWKASNPGPTPGVHTAAAFQQSPNGEIQPAAAPAPVQCPVLPFINQLEAKLRGMPGLDAVLTALIAHAQQNAAAGSKLGPGALTPASSKQEVMDVASLAAVQEQHSSARALPLLMRLYFNTGSRAETLAAGRPELLSAKLLERCLAVLAAKPVVPGYADVPVCLTSGLQACQGLSELAAQRKLKLPTELGKLDFKAAFKLDQSYSLQDKVLPLLQQHDELCDLLSQLALEVQQAMAVERDINPKAFDSAEQLMADSINFVAAAKSSLLDLDAWRLSTCGSGADSVTPKSFRTNPDQCSDCSPADASGGDGSCDRYKLKDEDVVPFMDILGAVKGFTSLLSNSSSWLQPLLHEHALKQLNEFALFTLPALSKLYARNPRLQDLMRAIYACMQGQPVEVAEDVDAAAAPAAAFEAEPAAAHDEPQSAARPLGEGFEGLKNRWGKKAAARKHAEQQEAAAVAAGAAVCAAEEAIAQAEVAASEDSVKLARLAAASEAVPATDAAARATAIAAAAADVIAATAAAEAAAATHTAASSPRSLSQIEVSAAPDDAVLVQPGASLEAMTHSSRPASRSGEAADAAGSTAAHTAAQDNGPCLEAAAAGSSPAEQLQTNAGAAPSAPADADAASATVPPASAAGQGARKRTLKGLFKLKASGRKRDKAALAAEEGVAAVRAEEAAMNSSGTTAAAVEVTEGDQPTALQQGSSNQGAQHGASVVQQQQQQQQQPTAVTATDVQQLKQRPQPPCTTFAWTDSETDMPLCQLKAADGAPMPSTASSMTDLNNAGFERPPDLPWELQGLVTDDSPRSVAHAAAMFERIAAAHRQLAAASGPRLSAAGREAAGSSKSSPGGWEGSAVSGNTPAPRLTDVSGSPLSKAQLAAMAQQGGTGSPGATGPQGLAPNSSTSSPAHGPSKRRPRLFGFRGLMPQRSEEQQTRDDSGSHEQQVAGHEVGSAEGSLAAEQQLHKGQLVQPLDGQQAEVLIAAQEYDDGVQAAEDITIPAAWGPAGASGQESKPRMKSMLSMLRRGNARSAAAGAAVALQAGLPANAAAAAAMQQQLAVAGSCAAAVAGQFGADAAADADVASQPETQPDASEDFDEDQPAKTRRVMGLMNRIRVFAQGSKEQQAQHAPSAPHAQAAGGAAGSRQGLKGLKFTAKFKKAMGDRRQSRFAEASGLDGLALPPLEALPSAACSQLLRVLLELLMTEIKAETKKHLVMQLQMAAAAAAGSAGVTTPDASLARPLKQVKQMVKAVHRMQLMVDFPRQLLAAADLSDLWVGAACGSSLATIAAAAAQQQHSPEAPAAPSQEAAAEDQGCQAPVAAEKQQQQPADAQKAAASVDLTPPSPKGLHPWSLYNLLFDEHSDSSVNDAATSSLAATSHNKAHKQHPDAAAGQDVPATAAPSIFSRSRTPTLPLHLCSFPASLIAACMQQLERMPAELPLLALQMLWDARRLLKECGLLDLGLVLLQQQEKLCVGCYMASLVPLAYEHFKRIAGHQTLTVELLNSCGAGPLQPLRPLYVDSLLREPCNLVLQADYGEIAAEAASAMQPGRLAAKDAQLADTEEQLRDAQHELQQHRAVDEVQHAARELQEAEAQLALAGDAALEGVCVEERPVSDQQQQPEGSGFSGVFTAAAKGSPGKVPVAAAGKSAATGASPGRTARKKRQGRGSKQCSPSSSHSAAAATAADGVGSGREQPAGVTPLMQKLEGMAAARDAEAAAERYQARRCLEAWGACELDVREWLVGGMLEALQQDAAVVVSRCSEERPTHLVEAQVHAAILQRTHALLAQYMALPLTWDQLWQEADAQQQEHHTCGSRAVAATVQGLLQLLDSAVYDAEAQVLLPVCSRRASQGPAGAAGHDAGVVGVEGVLREVEGALQPFTDFVGHQHLAALHALCGPLGVQQLITAVMDKVEQEQVLLLDQLLALQGRLPPSLLQLPPAEQYHSAGAVLQFYQQQLSGALAEHSVCSSALGCLQRMGNCLALLHLASVQQAGAATPAFMQVAPLLGIVGRPMTEAAAAAECFEGEDLPAPPSALAAAAAVTSGCHNLPKACTPGLLMPEIETLMPTDAQRHTYEMQSLKELHQEDVCRWEARQAGVQASTLLLQPDGPVARHRVWQASHFQRLLLGPDAEKVRGPAMLLTQTAELRAWRATQGTDVLGPCLQRLQTWAVQLQQQLQGKHVSKRRKTSHRQPQAAVPAADRSRHPAAGDSGPAADVQLQRRSTQQAPQQQARQQQQAAAVPITDERLAAAVLAATGLRSSAAAAAIVRALSAEPSAESFSQLTEQATEGDLTEVEQQLQALQAQVNAALIAAEERLRVVSMSPPQALLDEARPRLQLPPEPIPFSPAHGAQGAAGTGLTPTTAGWHAAEALDAEDSVQQASPRTAQCSAGGVADAQPDSATVPAFLGNDALAAAAEAAAAAAGLPHNPWQAADTATAQLPPGCIPPAQAKLAYKLLTQSTTASQQQAAFDALSSRGSDAAQLQHLELGALRSSSSGRAGLAELVGEQSDVSPRGVSLGGQCTSQQGSEGGRAAADQGVVTGHASRPGSNSSDQQLTAGPAHAEVKKDSAANSPRSPSRMSPTRALAASCPGRCEGMDDDAASEPDTGEAQPTPRSPRSPWPHPQQHSHLAPPGRSPSPQPSRSCRSRMFEAEGSLIMTQEAAFRAPDDRDEQQWQQGSPAGSQDGSKMRYPTPPITDLLYETTCDELVRVKDERDMLKSEVEVLRSQLQNRDNTLAMLSGQMLMTPRTSAADCESLMRAAMSDCSNASTALRSHPAVSGVPSLPSNTMSMGNSVNGGLAMRRAASVTLAPVNVNSDPAGTENQARSPLPAGSGTQQQPRSHEHQRASSRPRSAPQESEVQEDTGDAGLVTETSEIQGDNSKFSVRAQQTTPCADVNTLRRGNLAADAGTCSNSADSSHDSGDSSGSDDTECVTASSCCSSEDEDGLDEDLQALDGAESALISTASCAASRTLKLPRAVSAGSRPHRSSQHVTAGRTSSSRSSWPPAQLAVALSALKFALLLDAAMAECGMGSDPEQGLEGAAGGPQAPPSPLKRLRRAVEGMAAEAAAVAAGVINPLAADAAAVQQAAGHGGAGLEARGPGMALKGSGRMTTPHFGDGPLLASAVLLQLSGQARRFEVLDATSRITYWVEYDAVKASVNGSPGSAAGTGAPAGAAGALSPRGNGAGSSAAPSGAAAIVGAPGGIGAAAEGIAAPKPSSKKRQEEEAEAAARERAAAAAQQQLLERLAAAQRQAARVSKDGSSLAARFAPAAPARHQAVALRVYRVDHLAAQRLRAAGAGSNAGSCSSPGRITFGGGPASSMPGLSLAQSSSCAGVEQPKVLAVPVKAELRRFQPLQQPWAGLRPTQRAIQTHPGLPTHKPQPLLLGAAAAAAPRGGGVAGAGFVPAAVAGLPPGAAAAAAAAAAAGTGIVGPSGKLLTGASVAPRAGLVAAARVMAAREVVLQAVPRNAAYSFSVVSDQNRSGRPEDGYSMAPSSADLDSLSSESPRRSPQRQGYLSAAVGASAVRLGGRQRTAGAAESKPAGLEQWLAAAGPSAGPGGVCAAEPTSPTRSTLARSPPGDHHQGSKAAYWREHLVLELTVSHLVDCRAVHQAGKGYINRPELTLFSMT